ncbi:hypothetical protein CVT25_004768 [Psilocybe cyanescens]|uniref:Uncharacterized protein n=1 Tax=Psilocybe cyanescens TaxID=93625 RepID=A0A409VY44_PSICY|nr:hypothetical protein CVT25_004768 [Psilocybe cyanescens]
MLTLHDIPSTVPDRMGNPNVWKERLAFKSTYQFALSPQMNIFSLNFNGLPCTTEWVEYTSIEPLYKNLSIGTIEKKPDRSPHYTLPVIYDSSTGVSISDFLYNAKYLENTYPDTLAFFPGGTIGLQSDFNDVFIANVVKPLITLTLPQILPFWNPISAEYMKPRVRNLKSQNSDEDWKKVDEGMSQVDTWCSRSGEMGLFMYNDILSWVDCVVSSFLVNDSTEWTDTTSWNGGRWKSLSASMTIILYDIPSALPNKIWSPNIMKTRFSLNFKGIPFITQWVEYPDIEPLCKKLGLRPTNKWPDGRPYYSLPSIYDPSTGAYISDSILIAEYLEKTYPDTPKLFPNGTAGVQSAFNEGFLATLSPLLGLILPDMLPHLNPVSISYITPRVEMAKSKDREQDWIKLQEAMDQVDAWFARNGGRGEFLLGDIPSWADIVVVSWLFFMRRVWGEDSDEWKKIVSWNGGRWKNLSDAFKRYESPA